jgi:hypothetical protein
MTEVNQGMALSPLLFNLVFDVVTEGLRENPPWCLLYADNIVLIVQSRIKLERKLEKWRYSLESRMRKSRSNMEYFTTNESQDWI